jgi:plastocyanin
MKKIIIISLVLVFTLVAAGAYWFFIDGEKIGKEPVAQPTGEAAVTITRTKDGYEPKEVTINEGDIVEWKNESGEYHWPASDLHPTHGIYPEFDPLTAIAPGDSWRFEFDKPGVWKYHDHIRANKTGTITVK